MPKKPSYATEEDLAGMREEIMSEFQRTKVTLSKGTSDSRSELLNELSKLQEVVASNSETTKQAVADALANANKFSQDTVNKAKSELTTSLSELEEKMSAMQKNMDEQLQKLDTDLKTLFADELLNLTQQFDQEMTGVRNELLENSEKWAREAAEALVNERNTLNESIAAAKTESDSNLKTLKEAMETEFKKSHDESLKRLEDLNERNDRATTEIWLKLERIEELMQENKEEAKGHTDEVDERLSGDILTLRSDAEGRLDQLDHTVAKLYDAVTEVENLPTRRVDWVIKNVSKRLRPPSASKASLHTSWFSPKFDAAGAHGLQLELQFFKKGDPPVEGESAGDCAVFLWACKGMNLVYKLYIGTKSQTCEKVFNGRVPYGTKRLCFLKDQVNKEEDTLRVSVEILEAVREVEHPIKPAPPVEDGVIESEEDLRNKPLEGRILFRRHITNRLFEQVKTQVEVMRSRMVRRVEWRLEQASMLRKCFPPGEPMCSVAFAAAGVENMQIVFYPCGYQSATDGFCSIFLYAPAGCTMKFTLFGGAHRRDATHFFEATGAFGRTNFARFESLVDEETDTILLALEIEEAHQDVVARMAHPTVQPGDRRNLSQLEGAVPKAIESVVKMARNPTKLTQAALEDTRILPSLWTSKSLAEKGADELNAFKSFDELKSTKSMAASKSTRFEGPPSPFSASAPLMKSTSTPNLNADATALPPMLSRSSDNWSVAAGGGTTGPGSFGISPKKGMTRSSSRARQGVAGTMQVLQSGSVH
mmetsp:Transcript_25981/g.56412  ORF Transcript_25981/g.56412 Transcript_25981/m.56412 type:complete len:765 (-) Transcript_25981:7-2301(-)